MSIQRFSCLLLAPVFLFAPNAGRATTRTVPTQHPTIQSAIWASSAGDTVAVLPGTYVENIEIDRAVLLRSTAGPAVTVIDGGNPSNPDSASTVTMRAGEIAGFDIRNGGGNAWYFDEWHGGGIDASGSGTIRGNWIHDNVISEFRGVGGGVFVESVSAITLRDNRIYRNRIEAVQFGYAGGVAAHGSQILVEGNLISNNHVENGVAAGAHGWGAFRRNVIACNTVVTGSFANNPVSGLSASGGAIVEGNTIVFNWGIDDPPALSILANECSPPCPVQIFGNLVAYNAGPGVECRISHLGSMTFECNDFFSNTAPQVVGKCGDVLGENGNIVADPLFGRGGCPSETGDWCLAQDSPLLPENSPPGCGLIGAIGACPIIGVADTPAPSQIRGGPAAPNPFAERTSIPYHLASASAVQIAIVDVTGRQIRTLHSSSTPAGDHAVEWDGRTDLGTRAASGVYIAVIRAGLEEVTSTLLLVR